MVKRTVEEIRQYQREYYQQHKDQILRNVKDYRKSNQRKIKHDKKIWREKLVCKVNQILGIECVICGSTEKLFYHEIHGKPHTNTMSYILKHIEDFTRLCQKCHINLHHLVNQTNIPIEVLLVKLRELVQTCKN